MILKLLLVLGVIFFVYVFFIKQKSIKPRNSTNTNANDKRETPQEADELVQCQTCDVYVELDEAILSGSKYYCSTECINKA